MDGEKLSMSVTVSVLMEMDLLHLIAPCFILGTT